MTAISRITTTLLASATVATVLLTTVVSASVFAHPFTLKSLSSHQQVWTGKKQTVHLKIAVTGNQLKNDRPPVNVALVIDRSGSMGGQRIQQAKQAALMAIDMLRPDDIVSLVAYDNDAEVLIPATKLGDGTMIRKGINELRVNGSTALYAGTQLGGNEALKFFNKNQVNRVILLSDGIANVGPSSSQELAQLGAQLAGKGISVSTIGLGLGYNEDLMARLADASDGNHSFVEHPNQLARLMSLELNDALAVVAQDLEIKITFPEGVRPVRALGREADFEGQIVTSKIKDVVSGAERFVLIEAELNAGLFEKDFKIAQVHVSYRDRSGEQNKLEDEVSVKYATSSNEMKASTQAKVMESVVELVAREQQEMAIKLKDEGKDQEALKLVQSSNAYLEDNAKRYKSNKLKKMRSRGAENEKVIGEKGKSADWNRTRKQMRQDAYSSQAQMAF
jgi:Ca-activated chloride channel family protein